MDFLYTSITHKYIHIIYIYTVLDIIGSFGIGDSHNREKNPTDCDCERFFFFFTNNFVTSTLSEKKPFRQFPLLKYSKTVTLEVILR